VVARIEAQWSVGEIAKRFEMPTPDAARMAVGRALKRLTTKLHGKKIVTLLPMGLRLRSLGLKPLST
jgi:hypothetical protein